MYIMETVCAILMYVNNRALANRLRNSLSLGSIHTCDLLSMNYCVN